MQEQSFTPTTQAGGKYGPLQYYGLGPKMHSLTITRCAADVALTRSLMEFYDAPTRKRAFEAIECPCTEEIIEMRSFSIVHQVVLGLNTRNVLQNQWNQKEVNAIESDGFTPLCYAAARGDEARTVQLLLCGAAVEIQGHLETSALGAACASRSSVCIRPLLLAGANPNARDALGETCLHIVAMRQRTPGGYVAPLLEFGADINAQCDSGFTALLWAVQVNSLAMVTYLVKRGADINLPSHRGISAVGLAVLNNLHSVLTFLLSCGGSVKFLTEDGETILHLAAKASDQDTLYILQGAGFKVDSNAKNNAGKTAAELLTARNTSPSLQIAFYALLNSSKNRSQVSLTR